MNPPAQRLVAMSLGALLAALSTVPAGCRSPDATDATDQQLSDLVAKRAFRNEVIATLGPGSTWYGRKGDENYPHLLQFEPKSSATPVREAVAQDQGILFYTSTWQATWLFFDDTDRLRGYWLTSQ